MLKESFKCQYAAFISDERWEKWQYANCTNKEVTRRTAPVRHTSGMVAGGKKTYRREMKYASRIDIWVTHPDWEWVRRTLVSHEEDGMQSRDWDAESRGMRHRIPRSYLKRLRHKRRRFCEQRERRGNDGEPLMYTEIRENLLNRLTTPSSAVRVAKFTFQLFKLSIGSSVHITDLTYPVCGLQFNRLFKS